MEPQLYTIIGYGILDNGILNDGILDNGILGDEILDNGILDDKYWIIKKSVCLHCRHTDLTIT